MSLNFNDPDIKIAVFRDFTGGLNTRDNAYVVADNELVDATNVEIRSGGVVKSALGREVYIDNTHDFLVNGVRGGYRYRARDGTKKIIISCEDGVYADSDDGKFDKKTAIGSNDGFVRFAQFRDTVMMTTDREYTRYYKPGESTEVQIFSPNTNSWVGIFLGTSTVNYGGILDDKHYVYRFTYDCYHGDDFLGESMPLGTATTYSDEQGSYERFSEKSIDHTAGGSGTNVTKITKIDPLGNRYFPWYAKRMNVYRSGPLDSAVGSAHDYERDMNFYFIGTVTKTSFDGASNGDVIFSDEGKFTIGRQIRYDIIHTPPRARFLATHKGRVWLGYCSVNEDGRTTFETFPHRVYYSYFGPDGMEPTVFSPSGYLEVGASYGDEITGLMSYKNKALVVFKSSSIHVINGGDEEISPGVPDIAVEVLSADVGCIAPESIAVAEGALIWLSARGLEYYDGTRPRVMSEKVNDLLFSIPSGRKRYAVGIYDSKEREYRLSFTAPEDSGNTNRSTLVYNFVTGSWTERTEPIGVGTLIEVRDLDSEGYVLVCHDDNSTVITGHESLVEKMDRSGTEADGDAISWSIETKAFDFGSPHIDKEFLGVCAEMQSRSAISVDVRVDNRIDTVSDGSAQSMSQPTKSTDLIWEPTGQGVYTWDNFNWAGSPTGLSGFSYVIPKNKKGKRLAVRLSDSTSGRQFELYTLMVAYKEANIVKR